MVRAERKPGGGTVGTRAARLRAAMLGSALAIGVAVSTLGAAAPAADLQPETVAAYDRYVRATDTRVSAELADPARALWVDTLPDARRATVMTSLRGGDVTIEPLTTRDAGGSPIEIPDGLVHHFVGTVFLPGAALDPVVALMQDYDSHDEVFAPAIANSRLLSHDGNVFTFTMRFVVTGMLASTIETEQRAVFSRPAPDRANSRIASTRIQEVRDPGTARETLLPVGHDRGYLWRQTSYWRFVARDGGTYVQCEAISLSRRVPTGLGWLLGGAAAKVPRETLAFTLRALRDRF